MDGVLWKIIELYVQNNFKGSWHVATFQHSFNKILEQLFGNSEEFQELEIIASTVLDIFDKKAAGGRNVGEKDPDFFSRCLHESMAEYPFALAKKIAGK